jgi:hypothetical protein
MNKVVPFKKPSRTCSNCCSYDQGECCNGIGIFDPEGCCDQHMTLEEDRKETEALNRFRASLGLPPLSLQGN